MTYPSRRAMREAERAAASAVVDVTSEQEQEQVDETRPQPAGRRAAVVAEPAPGAAAEAAPAAPAEALPLRRRAEVPAAEKTDVPSAITTAELDALFNTGEPITATVEIPTVATPPAPKSRAEARAARAATAHVRAERAETRARRERAAVRGRAEQVAAAEAPEAEVPDATLPVDPTAPARAHDAGIAHSRRVREKEGGQLHEGSRARHTPRRGIRRPHGIGVAEQVPHRPVGGRRRTASKFVGVLAMLFSGGLLVATSLPANAFFVDGTSVAEASAARATAGVTIQASGGAAPATALRDDYTVSSFVQKFRIDNQKGSFTNNPYGTIQWPFAAGVPMSAGFGMRDRPCAACSANHKGLDFVPGEGAPIQAIADGVVITKSETDSGFGNYVVIQHEVNGQDVQSLYAHMGFNTITVDVGDTVRVGQQVGNVGNTGTSTGAHLHFEIHLDGVPVDPFAWMSANAN
ncbi:M23 family metallopeptidase [Herbiconiux sp. SYSU D00978]|uniref:M23 family metallopeptidase n=1 Tax=Herbiconiux sp. SYSU D00978 TaxID=2812562 RepID=UPI001A9723C9|nr:M23 family metallopeptidase [Herbiconiux sp. SYSU D00978]